MENPNDYFNGWIKTQQQAYSALQNQMQSLYPPTAAVSDNPFTSWSKAVFEAFPVGADATLSKDCLLYTSPSPRDRQKSRMPSSA